MMEQLRQETADADRIRWANVHCWQASGFAIGALIPTSSLVFLPRPTVETIYTALHLAPLTAVIGAIAGTVIGIRDRGPSLGWDRTPLREPAQAAGVGGRGKRALRLVLTLRPVLAFESLCLAVVASVLAAVHLGYSSLAPDRVVLGVQVWSDAKSPKPNWTDSFSLEDLCLLLILPCGLLGSCLGAMAVFRRRRVRRAAVTGLAWNVGMLLYVGVSVLISRLWR